MTPGSTLPALDLVRTHQTVRVLAALLLTLFLVMPVFLLLAPWQQNVTGAGRVSAVNPMERQQMIDTPVEGRVVRWHVAEGMHVKAGDPVVELSDIDPSMLTRLEQEREAVLRRMEAARSREMFLVERITGLEGSRRNSLDANRSRIQVANDRLRAAEQALAQAEAALVADRLNLDRHKKLLEKGLTAVRNVELAQMAFDRSVAEVDRAKAAINGERNGRAVLEADQLRIETDFKSSIEDARASRATALAEIANANAELQRTNMRVSRQSFQLVKAPREGIILRL